MGRGFAPRLAHQGIGVLAVIETNAAARVPGLLRCETRTREPLGHGLAVEAQRASDLGDGQGLMIPSVVDFGERLVVDHDRLRGQGGTQGRLPDMARMSWRRRSKRSVVRTMSS